MKDDLITSPSKPWVSLREIHVQERNLDGCGARKPNFAEKPEEKLKQVFWKDLSRGVIQ